MPSREEPRLANSCSSRDLPIPGSPTTSITRKTSRRWARPFSKTPSSISRPANSVKPRSMDARSRLAPSTIETRLYIFWGVRFPFTSYAPINGASINPSNNLVTASLSTMLPGSARCCSRDARFIVSPIAVNLSLSGNLVITAVPALIPTRTASRKGRPSSSVAAAEASRALIDSPARQARRGGIFERIWNAK